MSDKISRIRLEADRCHTCYQPEHEHFGEGAGCGHYVVPRAAVNRYRESRHGTATRLCDRCHLGGHEKSECPW